MHSCHPQKDVTNNYSYFPVYFNPNRFGKSRDNIYNILKDNKIYARKYFYPAINELTPYKDCIGSNTPVAHDVSMNILTLPIYSDLDIKDVDRICDIILGD